MNINELQTDEVCYLYTRLAITGNVMTPIKQQLFSSFIICLFSDRTQTDFMTATIIIWNVSQKQWHLFCIS